MNYSNIHTISGQCPVSAPTIVSSPDDICRVVSQGSLSYTCTNNGLFLTWTSSVWSGSLNIVASTTAVVPPLNVTGVTLMENNNNNATCLSSTLTFNGTFSNLAQLNGVMLTCSDPSAPTDTITIVVPRKLLAFEMK